MRIFLLFCLMLVFAGCIPGISKKATDKNKIRFCKKKQAHIKEAVQEVILLSGGWSMEFGAAMVRDDAAREKISALGDRVEITYATVDDLDSVVIFKTITLAGITEIIYDFALRSRAIKARLDGSALRLEYFPERILPQAALSDDVTFAAILRGV